MAAKKYLDYDGLVELVAKIKELVGAAGHITFKGTVATVSALPTVADANVGDMYTVTAEGKTTADFTDGAGKLVAANSEVAAVNVGTAAAPQMKWALIGPVFDVSDKLTFGETMPSNPADEDTFLYMGDTTYTYAVVSDPTGKNPKEEGWYVSNGSGGYVATTDETPQSGTTYYTQHEQYVTGVIYKYNEATASWVAKSAGDTYIAITTAEVDSLFE